ncbi:MAG TPA: transcriptional initiation protein Tat [Myxococcales bacterium]|nr:transcriptional initiation protein Tat [Deltaproteobacteria bacterium]HAA57616.1 transcriptional initiation protein Tat [Myxococcales bacterium]|tara:strand:- start:6907 stop:8274 length:1368 start_codon:yes stop_codon:yes gene_type:complete
MKRRYVLKSLGFGAGAYMLAPSLQSTPIQKVKANPEEPERYFIQCYFSGGWDILLSLDPRDPGKFTDSRIKETRIQPGYDRLPTNTAAQFRPDLLMPKGSNIDWGPVMGGFARHFDVSCVVRGVAMDTVSHVVGRRYFITGMMPRGQNAVGSSLSSWIVSEQGAKSPIPNLVVGVESYNRGLPAYASGLKVSGVNDLKTTLSDMYPKSIDKTMRHYIEDYRQNNTFCDPAALDEDGLLSMIQSAQVKARSLVSKDLNQYFDFNSSKLRDIRDRYNTRSGSGAQAAMAFQAIKHNVAQTITIHLTGGLDTHGTNWATTQSQRQYDAFKALGVLVDDLKATPHPTVEGAKLIDYTTIMCCSEFSRTPILNASGGRDHWLANASLLVGAGVPHNKVVGATSNSGFNPMTVDPITGEPADGGVIITPTRIFASIMQAAGYQYNQFRVDGLPCLMDTAKT